MTNPDRVAFSVFGRDIYWYGVIMAVGIIIAALIAMSEGKRKKLYDDAIIDMCLVIIPCGIVGARLYYVLFELKSYLDDPIRMLYIWEGGLAIYGAVIGGLLGAYFFGRKKKIRFLKLADCIAPGLVLAQAIGRWGNFFNQEAYGLPINNDALKWFPFAVRIDVPWNNGVHYFNGEICTNPFHMATFFYESVWCLIVFIVLWSMRKKFKHDGDAFFTYAMLYGLERMLVERLRGDSLWLIRPDTWGILPGGIRVSEMLSAILFIGILAFFIIRGIREKKEGRLMWPAPEVISGEAVAEADADASETDTETEDAADATPTEAAEPDTAQSKSETQPPRDAEDEPDPAQKSEPESEPAEEAPEAQADEDKE